MHALSDSSSRLLSCTLPIFPLFERSAGTLLPPLSTSPTAFHITPGILSGSHAISLITRDYIERRGNSVSVGLGTSPAGTSLPPIHSSAGTFLTTPPSYALAS